MNKDNILLIHYILVTILSTSIAGVSFSPLLNHLIGTIEQNQKLVHLYQTFLFMFLFAIIVVPFILFYE